jgi:NAD(P)-dependent dehydrogenase (short-subunit alcohol dehydrogenase family)
MGAVTVTIDLAGAVAVVTGGGGGIGRATVERLAAAGAAVEVAEIDPARGQDVKQAVAERGGDVCAHAVDVTDPAQVEAFRDTVLAERGRVDVLVNNVGHYLRATAFLRSDAAHWQALLDVNLMHVLHCTRAFAPAMVEQGSGSIVNVSSVEGLRGYPPDPVYGAAKAAVVHFTRCLALELGSSGVRVNAIAPDVTQTIQVDYFGVADDLADRWPVWVPVGRMGEPADQADVVLFLASDLARFVTGHTLPTEGGTLAGGGWFRIPGTRRWTNRPRDP